jgi:hypothetical protein
MPWSTSVRRDVSTEGDGRGGAVLLVHGMNATFGGPMEMAQKWVPALADGVRLAGGPVLDADDVGCVFYGDVFRQPGVFPRRWTTACESGGFGKTALAKIVRADPRVRRRFRGRTL